MKFYEKAFNKGLFLYIMIYLSYKEKNMKHYMKLQDDPFKKIKNKTKTIEMRLNDEKKENKTG